jgi:predicted TIM-barrel fold metal-dependent hydrolase
VIVPYSNPLKGGDSKFARYFPDLAVCRRDKDGVERVTIYEIKPAAQTQMPKKTKGKGKRRMTAETAEFAKNMAKWEAADRYCKKRGWTFQILTEKELKLGDSTWQ